MVLHWLIILIFTLFCVLLIFYCIISRKYNNYCDFLLNTNLSHINNSNIKPTYKTLSKSNTNPKLTESFLTQNKLFCLNSIYKNKDYLLTLSKFIDYKINNNKTTFKSLSGKIVIEDIVNHLTGKLIQDNKISVFQDLKNLSTQYNLKQKELKIFKLLFAKNLLLLLSSYKENLDNLLKIINKSKNAKYIHFYKNSTYFYAQIYGICKYNKNSRGLILKENINNNYIIARFLKSLYQTKYKIDVVTSYLMVIFN